MSQLDFDGHRDKTFDSGKLTIERVADLLGPQAMLSPISNTSEHESGTSTGTSLDKLGALRVDPISIPTSSPSYPTIAPVLSPQSQSRSTTTPAHLTAAGMSPIKRQRALSTNEKERPPLLQSTKREIYTRGRPPWYTLTGNNMKEAFIIGLSGGSASGKTTVAARIIEELDLHWVVILSMDSFYKVLTAEQVWKANECDYNFDHPDAFDFELMNETLRSLKAFKRTEVPQYDFSTHSRMKDWKTYYGANVILFEGILAFVNKEVRDLLDVKIFVDTDSDIRLCRRLSRDISERGRDLRGVLKQYDKFVKPAFDSYIEPSKLYADIIVPRGAENEIAIDMIVKLVSNKFLEAGTTIRAELDQLNHRQMEGAKPNLLPQTNSVRALHTKLRNKNTPRDQFIFYSLRLMRLLVEYSLSLLPYEESAVSTHMENPYRGLKFTGAISAVSVLRSGETLEQAVAEVVKDAKIGKLLIQTNPNTLNPELYYLRLPKDIKNDFVLLLDSTVTSGAALLMAIRILLDHEVEEEKIIVLTLVVSQRGLNAVSYVYPRVKIVTSAVDDIDSDNKHCLVPGIGSFGDRFFGTDIYSTSTSLGTAKLEQLLQEVKDESRSSCSEDIEDYES